MRKFLSFAIALMMTATAWAVGAGNGMSQSDAIDFDMGNVYVHDAGVTSWYCVDLTQLDAAEPALALYLTNRTDEMASVTLSVSATMTLPFVGNRDYNMDPVTYNIAAKGHEIWSLVKFNVPVINQELSLKEVLERGLVSKVYLKLTANKQIAVSSEVYEESEIVEDACTKAVDFNWAGESVAAGEKWFYLNLAAVKSGDKKLDFVVENNGAADAHVAFDLALTCPVSAYVKEYDWTIPAGGNMTEALGRMLLDQLSDDFVYLRLTTDQPITLSAVEQPLPPTTDLFDPAGATALEIGKKYTIDATHDIFVVDMASLKAPKGYKTVCTIESQEASDVVLVQEIAFATPVTNNNTEVKNLTVPANATMQINVASKMVDAIKSDKAYLRLKADGGLLNLTMQYVKLDVVTTPTVSAPSCEKSFVFDWNSSIKHKAYATKWYEFDLSSLKQNGEQVQLSFTNHSDSLVVVMGTIMLDCASKDSIPYALPIPAGKTVSKVFEYSILAASPLERAYVSVTMVPTTITSLADLKSVKTKEDAMALISLNMDTEVELTATKTSALVDPTACEAAPTITKGVTYTQEAGTTKWYRVSDALLEELSFFPEVTFVNNGDKSANITLGTTVGCDYGILTRGTVTVPTWFDLTMTLTKFTGLLVDKLVNQDVTEYYIEVTTDQPIMFGVDIAYGNAFGCDDATEFNWNTGVTLTPRDAKWYHVDITDLKANEQQAKLTFTNPADSIAWVAAFLTYECPFRVGLPMIFPVPAGVSVDKWIDYSFIASAPTNDLYLAVYTDTPLEIKAMQESAVIAPVADCLNATVVEPNVQYTVAPGTSWYKFSAEPFVKTTDTHARLSFSNKSGKTAHVTTGATVGCEYGILTRGKLPVPQMDVDVTVPTWVFGLLSKFVDEEVNQYYVEVTTDEPLQFQIEMEMPCADPVYVTDSIAEVLCPGTEFVNPYTNDTLIFAIDTVIVDTVETEDPCLFNVHMITLTTMQQEFVLDTAYVYWCEGKEFVHPVTGVVTTIFEDTTFVDTLATATPCVDSVVVYVVAPVKAPQYMTKEILDSIGAVPVLHPGYMPDTTGTVAKIMQYYADNDSETVADVLEVTWEGADAVIDCEAAKHKMKLVVTAECENVMTIPFNFEVTPQVVVVPASHIACESYTWAQNGKTYDASGVYGDTIDSQITGCDSIIYTLNLTILPAPQTLPAENKTICYGGSYPWNGQDCNETKTYTHVVKNVLGCDSLIYTLNLTVLPEAQTLPAENKTICYGGSYPWNGQDCNETKTYTHVVKNVLGCDSLIYTLNLTVLPDVQTLPAENKTICYGGSYPWNGQDCNETKTYTHVVKNVLGCDSLIYTLNLTVLPEAQTLPAENKTICYGTSYSWNGQDCNETKTYTHVVKNVLGCDSLIYTLNLTVRPEVTLPAKEDVASGIVAICGKTLDVTAAEEVIKQHAAAIDLFPAITSIEWNTQYTTQTLNGLVEKVVLTYTLQTECESVASETIEIEVENPSYENLTEMQNVPVERRYGDRLLTVNLVYIQEKFATWNVTENDVVWYKDNGTKVESVATGYYLTTADGTPLEAATYYALIKHEATAEDECDGVLQTELIAVVAPAAAPKLAPTVARPQELIRVLNLDANAVTTISVYSTTGELIESFQVANQPDASFTAAQLAGYYVVDVQTETEKVSLRYIVK